MSSGPQFKPNTDSRTNNGTDRATGFQGLGSALRVGLRHLVARSGFARAVAVAEEMGERAATPSAGIREEALTSAGLSWVGGQQVKKIGLMFDISLRSEIVKKVADPEEQQQLHEVLAAARTLRRDFNGVSRRQPRFIDCAVVEKVVSDFQRRCGSILLPGRANLPIEHACREVRHSLKLERRGFLPWQEAREYVARLLGVAREVVAGPEGAKASDSAGVVSCDARRALREQISCLVGLANACGDSLEEGVRSVNPTLMIGELRRISTVLGADAASASSIEQSAPTKLAVASRRSLCGNKLGALSAFESSVDAFARDPSRATLAPVVEVLECWWQGENPRAEGAMAESVEQLERNPLSVPRTSRQAIFRDTVLPVLRWSLEHLDDLSGSSRRDLVLLLRSSVVALHALTVREIAETLDVALYPRNTEGICGPCESTLVRKMVGFGRFGGVLGAVLCKEADEGAAYGVGGKTIEEISDHFQVSYGETSEVDRKYLTAVMRWAARRANAYSKEVPELPQENALWLSEYDGGQDARLPKEIQRRFVTLQEDVVVPAGSTRSGFRYPESEEWLREHVSEHDGFLIAMTEGDPRKPFCDQEPDTIMVATCSQNVPSPLLREIEKNAENFIAALPQPKDGSTSPHVVAELAVSDRHAALAVRSYGEHPVAAVYDQFVFNVISRFPAAERVECFATCREGSVAMSAHERLGWRKTGHIYVDEHGTRFDIIHTTLYPAAVLCGTRDI